MGSEFTDSGKYIGWSPYFNLQSESLLRASEELPMPDGKNYVVNQGVIEGGYDISLFVDKLNNSFKLNNQEEYLKTLGLLFSSIRDSGNTTLYYTTPDSSDNRLTIKNIEDYINRHTLYLTKVKNVDKIISMTKNSFSSKAYRIINDPSNVVAAFSPVEMNEPRAAAELSTSGKIAKTLSPWNPFVKARMQYENMSGKDVIGVAANGEKVFFALSYYYNEAARRNDQDWLRHCLFERKFNIVRNQENNGFIPVTRNILTNVNFDKGVPTLWKNIIETQPQLSSAVNKYTLEELNFIEKDLIRQLGSQKDASLVISALLSAATDNAKELILSKINSGSDLAKVYLYGIMIGLDFKDIAALMTSDTVQSIISLNKSSIFDDYNISSNIDQTLNMLENGINLNKYNISETPELKAYIFNIADKFLELSSAEKFNYNYLSVKNIIGEIFKSTNSLNIIRDLRMPSNLNSAKLNKTISTNLARYLNDLGKLTIKRNSLNIQTFNTFKDLYTLSDEITNMASILGVNQGIRTDQLGKIQYFNNIEKAVTNRVKLYLADDKISNNKIIEDKPYLKRLYGEKLYDTINSITSKALNLDMINNFNPLTFLNDESYRNVAIEFYDLIKGTFNTLDVISKTPHFRAMIDSTAVDFGIFNAVSSKFTAIYNLTKDMIKEASTNSKGVYREIASKDKNIIYRGVSDYIDDVIIQKWFDSNKTGIIINKGNDYFTASGKLQQANKDEIIYLNSNEGQATFKKWFEDIVIPNIKLGLQSSENQDKKIRLESNRFVQSLQLTSNSRTLTGNTKFMYALPMNMSSISSQTELNNFVSYLSEFDELSNYSFNDIPITDLFFYYNLIVHKNKYNQNSFVSLFENSVLKNTDSVVTNYFNFVGNLDYNNLLDNDSFNIEDLRLYCALPYKPGRNSMYVKKLNFDTDTYDIYVKSEEGYNTDYDETIQDEIGINDTGEDDGIPNYDYIKGYSKLDLNKPSIYFNYFPSIQSSNITVNTNITEILKNKIKQLIKQNKALIEYGCK